ncbi:hypothetical protein SAMN02910292_01503 [Lachnospiraceae bacterium XBB2008]|nr:hypothetical protein SAMN02910292_01503 [Lachnospiraceae bacterium XBB2008]
MMNNFRIEQINMKSGMCWCCRMLFSRAYNMAGAYTNLWICPDERC